MKAYINLVLNVLAFEHSSSHLTLAISNKRTNNAIEPIQTDIASLKTLLPAMANENKLFVYDKDGTYPSDSTWLTLPTKPMHAAPNEKCWSLPLLKRYYSHKLKKYFVEQKLVVNESFVSDTEVWLPCATNYNNCKGYRSMSLRVQFQAPLYQPELVVIMNEVHAVYQSAVSDSCFAEFDSDGFGKVLYNNKLYRYKCLPEEAQRQLHNVYPCLNPNLKAFLKFSFPPPDKSNRYLKFMSEIESFREKYLQPDAVKHIFNLSAEWKKQSSLRLENEKTDMQFGAGTHTDPMQGMRLFGPKTLMKQEVVFFFIFHKPDLPFATRVNNYLKGDETDFKSGLNGFLRMKYNTVSALSIMFENKNNPLPEIKRKLSEKQHKFENSKRYVAIYLSPHSRDRSEANEKKIYYELKELLLQHDIITQTIEVDKTWGTNRTKETKKLQGNDGVRDFELAVFEKKFNYCLPNILVAIHAKLGGTPWGLSVPASTDLVIGISAYKSKEIDETYMGSTFVFDSEGSFQRFNCFKHRQMQELAGSIALAVKQHCQTYNQLNRLVIHFYKELPNRDLYIIEDMLSKLNLHVPVVVISINKSFAEDVIGFDISKSHLMPASGTVLALPHQQYLLYNNQLTNNSTNINTREGYPFPLKMRIKYYAPGQTKSADPDLSDLEEYMAQVCRFSQLYWKSVSRQWMPVTLRYPEMLAQIFPHFNYKDLSNVPGNCLWFL